MVDVSVIVPCYGSELFLEECIASVIAQKGVEVEIIAVEDRSPDKTWDVLQSLAARYPNIVATRMEQNSGQARARNKGLDLAKGRYVAFLDSDDLYLHPNVLSEWVAAADANQLELCVGQYAKQFEDGTIWYPAKVAIPPETGAANRRLAW